MKKLGTIEVTFTRCNYLSTALEEKRSHDFQPVGKEGVPEKTLKGRAISNHATLGKAEAAAPSAGFAKVEYPYGDRPFAHYIFEYRSRRKFAHC
jgi:hypothetical protein